MSAHYLVINANVGISRKATRSGYLLYWVKFNADGKMTSCTVDSWRIYRTIKSAVAVAARVNPNATMHSNVRVLPF